MRSYAKERKTAVKAAFGMLLALCFLTSCAAPQESSPKKPEDTAASDGAYDWEADRGSEDEVSAAVPEESGSEKPEGAAVQGDANAQEADRAIEDEKFDAALWESRQKIIENMVTRYGAYGQMADQAIEDLLQDLESLDPDAAVRWGRIMDLWRSINTELAVQYKVLPDGLPDTDELCIVALGFQLDPNGAMAPELVGRLEVVKASAEKYPNAWIVCTGGGTAARDPSATEAGKMAEWLIEQGIDESRILLEDRSLTTAQNALFTYELLAGKAPQVTELAIISSDYHIAVGTLLFEAEAILQAPDAQEQRMTVAANAAWAAPSGYLGSQFQARALLELFRNTDTADQ